MKRHIGIYIAFVGVVFAWASPAGAQEDPVDELGNVPQGRPYTPAKIALAVTTNRKGRSDPYQMGEPVYVRIHLTNSAAQIASVKFRPALEADVQIKVESPRNAPALIHNPFPSVVIAPKATDYLPFETRTYSLKLLKSAKRKRPKINQINGVRTPISWPGLVFDVPGDYRIYLEATVEANYTNRFGLSTTVPAEIHFKATPKGSPEAVILFGLHEDLKRMEAYHRLLVQPAERGFFESALKTYPKTYFAPYFAYMLARSYAEDKRADAAMGMYEKILRDFPLFPLYQAVMNDLAKLYDQQGYSDKAYSLVRTMINENPESMYLNRNTGLMRRFASYDGMRYQFQPNLWMLAP